MSVLPSRKARFFYFTLAGAEMLNDLRNELSRLYADTDSARRIVSDANIPGIFVDFDGPVIDVWHQVIQQARIRQKLPALVQAAMRDYPQSAILQRVYGALVYGSPSGESTNNYENDAMPDNETKFDRMYEMVFKTSERVSVLRTWLIALTIAFILAVVWFGWRLP